MNGKIFKEYNKYIPQSVDKVQYSFLFFEIVIKLICKVAYYLNNFTQILILNSVFEKNI